MNNEKVGSSLDSLLDELGEAEAVDARTQEKLAIPITKDRAEPLAIRLAAECPNVVVDVDAPLNPNGVYWIDLHHPTKKAIWTISVGPESELLVGSRIIPSEPEVPDIILGTVEKAIEWAKSLNYSGN